MSIYYKFKSAKDYEIVPVNGNFVSVLELKQLIIEKMKLKRQPDFDLLISNAQTNEEYPDETFPIPRNTSVLVRRVPGAFRMVIRTEPKVVEQKVETPVTKSTEEDELGPDLYAIPEPAAPKPDDQTRLEEEAKIKAFVETTASDWQRQTQQAYVQNGTRRFVPTGKTTPFNMRRVPPEGYVCHRCHQPGHFIQHCPTNGDPAYDIKKVRPPTGIPRTMLVTNPEGSYALPNGATAALKPNEDLFEKEVNALTTASKIMNDIPPELRCPLCKQVLKDAVLTSRCCYKSFCDECIRNEIITKSKCVCGATNVQAESLLPNRTLRDAIDRFLESNVVTSSAANSGSKHNSGSLLPDLQSSRAGSPSKEQAGSKEQKITSSTQKDAPNDEQKEKEVSSAPSKEQETPLDAQKDVSSAPRKEKSPSASKPRPRKLPGSGYGYNSYWPGDGYMMPYGYGYPYGMVPDPYAMGYPGYFPGEYPEHDHEEYSRSRREYPKSKRDYVHDDKYDEKYRSKRDEEYDRKHRPKGEEYPRRHDEEYSRGKHGREEYSRGRHEREEYSRRHERDEEYPRRHERDEEYPKRHEREEEHPRRHDRDEEYSRRHERDEEYSRGRHERDEEYSRRRHERDEEYSRSKRRRDDDEEEYRSKKRRDHVHDYDKQILVS